ncbi:MAG: hypothetical protein JXA90_01015, partial [Planctomycetes bacterium]|nr:hypothetical protein [Planctomycetota bacterium]
MTMMMARASRRPPSRLSPRFAASARRLGRRRLAPFQPPSRLSPRLGALSAALLITLTLAGTAPAERGAGRALPSVPQAPPESGARKNLVPGGDFEKGDARGPAGWQRPDGLTS